MEQGFKIAIWMLCLIGYLQAKPVPTPVRSEVSMGDLGIDYLRNNVKCGNKTFTSPTNVKDSCRLAAVQHFMDQLVFAREQCTDGKEPSDVKERISGTLQTLDVKVKPLVPTDTSTCELETKTSQFDKFVNATEAFVQNLNSN